jgi:hypothetical protein
MLRCLLSFAFVLGLSACHTGASPQLTVIGVHEAARQDVVYVQVTNPANRPMRLTKLEYTFAAGSATVSEGEVALQRDVPAGEAVVVEVPLDAEASEEHVTLHGKLTAELDQIVRIFNVSAEVHPTSAQR